MEEIRDITVKLESLKKSQQSMASVPGVPMTNIDEHFVKGPISESRLLVSASPPEPPVRSVARRPQLDISVQLNSKKGRDMANAAALQERCRQICLSLFFREDNPVRSLGFTSALDGEGKSFLAMVMANILEKDVSNPVTLLECNWEHPSLHEYFGIPSTPGVAEWLRGECAETDIRHRINHNLTVIPAGDGKYDAVKFIQQMKQRDLLSMFTTSSNEFLIVDLPAVLTCAYSPLLASFVESLIIVIRAGQTNDRMLVQTCDQLKNLPVEGLILNQVRSKIPRWIQQLL